MQEARRKSLNESKRLLRLQVFLILAYKSLEGSTEIKILDLKIISLKITQKLKPT